MQLFHHYIQVASDGAKANSNITWFNWVLRFATHSQPLMDAVLSLAAFHIHHQVNPADKVITEAAHRYMARAIQGHSRQLRDGINADNADEIFATSTCLGFHVISGRHLEATGEHNLLHWFQPWQNLKRVLQSCWPLMKTDDVKMLMQQEVLESNNITVRDTDGSLGSFNFLIDDLPSLDVDPEVRTAYEVSVRYLNNCYADSVDRQVLKFPGIVTERYVKLVGEKDWRALTILGYYFMLVIRFEKVWWLQGAAERDFGFLMEELPEFWKLRMAWAVREFEWHEERRPR
ncbi:hypothetical protein LSUE1_G000602 [Lachnellula suecica]|uniref:Uncharacterized protein n=1 Tax=Lachnellula suecica TaxID=602035 RepID=A0A8T9CFC5_9HELO|nr:hypothetical protein LSUE1_G000602 [Lachnellula suecica]